MSTLKDLRTLLLESYLDGMIDDDEFILLYNHLYDEIFCENPEFPYVFLKLFLFTIMTSKYYMNTETTH